jgi:hypothetical protein
MKATTLPPIRERTRGRDAWIASCPSCRRGKQCPAIDRGPRGVAIPATHVRTLELGEHDLALSLSDVSGNRPLSSDMR